MRKVTVLSFIDEISEWSGKIVSFVVLVAIGVMIWEVVARYVFSKPTIWANDVASFCLCVYVLIGGAYTLLHHGHVNMDIVYRRFSPRGRAILDLITFPFFLAVCTLLLWQGGEMLLWSLRKLEVSISVFAPPLYPVKAMMPLGGLLILLMGAANFARNLTMAITGKRP